MSNESPNGRITVSEDRLRQILAEFKLELFAEFAKKASSEALELVSHRVLQLELWQASVVATEGDRERGWARQLAVWTLAATVAGVIVTLIWLHHK